MSNNKKDIHVSDGPSRRDFLKIMGMAGISAYAALNLFPSDALCSPHSHYAINKNEKKAPIEIYLTIDDGPSEYTREIIKNLEGNMAAFFMIGRNIDNHVDFSCREECIEFLEQMINEGYMIGNHSYSHPHFAHLSLDEGKRDIEKADNLLSCIYSKAGQPFRKLFRFPGNEYVVVRHFLPKSKILKKMDDLAEFIKSDLGYAIVPIDVDSEDYKHYTSEKEPLPKIIKNVDMAKNGKTLLVHEKEITAEKVIPYIVNSGRYILISL